MKKAGMKKGVRAENEWMYSKMKSAYALHEIVTDKNGRPVDYVFLRVNKAFEKMTGLNAAKITEKPVTKILPGIRKDKSRWIEKYGAIALFGGDLSFESYSEALKKWYSVYAYSPMKGLFATVFTDISEIKEDAKKSKEAERITKKYLDIAGSIIVVVGLDGRVKYANKKCAEILKMRHGSLEGTDWVGTAVPEQYRKKLREELKKIGKTGKTAFAKNENPVIDSKGNQHIISWVNVIMKDSTGRPESVISYGEEITQLRHAENIIVRQAEYEKLRAHIWKIAAGSAPSEKKMIQELLDNCGPVIGADRLSYNVVKNGKLVCVQEWAAKGVKSSLGSALSFDIVKGFVKGRGIVQINQKKALAMTPRGIKGALYRQILRVYVQTLGLKAVMFMPLYLKEGLKGIITADLTDKKKEHTEFGADEEKILSELTAIVTTVIERKESEEEIENSRERFRTLFESAPDAYYLNDIRGSFIDGNGAAERLLGYKRGELISKDFRNARLLPLKYLPAALKNLAANAAGRKTGPDEFELIRKDGSLVDVEIATNPVEIGGRKMVLGIARDISARKDFEKQLAENEEKYRAVFEGTKDMIFIVEIEKNRMPGKVIKANNSAIKNLGFSENELRKMNVADLDIEGSTGISPLQIVKDVVVRGYSVFERSLMSKQGVIIPVEITAKAVRLSGVQAAFISARDLTGQKAAEQQVRESLLKYRGLFDSMGDAVFLYSSSDRGGIIEANEMSLKLTGCEKSELLKKSIYDLDVSGKWPDAGNIGENTSFEASITTKNSKPVQCEVSARKFMFRGEAVVIAIVRDVTEKIAAKAKLELDAKILDATTEAIFVHDLSGRLLFVNNAACEHLGRAKSGLIGNTIMRVVDDPSEPELVKSRIEELKNEKKLKFETIHVTGNGVRKPVEIHAVMSEINNVPLIISAVRDITERKKWENELKKMFYAIEQSHGPVVITDVNGNIEYVNQKFCEVTGYSRQEVLGKNPKILKSGEKTDADYKSLWETIKAGNEWKGEFHNRRKDGTLYWESASIYPITDDKGGITGYMSLKEDITEKKRIYEEIEQNVRMMKDFLDNANDLIQMVGIDGRFLYVNSAWKNTLGYSGEEVNRMTIFNVIHEKNRQHCMELFEKVKKGQCQDFIETVFVAKDGREIVVEGTVTCRFEAGVPVSTRAIFRDVTAKRETERRLKESYDNLNRVNILKSNFVSMVSHELRTPITSIKGFTAFLSKGVAGPVSERQAEFLGTIENNTDRLLNLINDLLDSTKIESGTFKVEKAEADTADVITSSVEEMKPVAARKQIEIVPVIKGVLPRMMIDTHRINQVIINLVNNAVKFSPENSRIEVGAVIIGAGGLKPPKYAGEVVFPSKKHLEVRVKDRGIGMETDNLAKIFERYYQISGTDKPAFKGLGLGLNISKTIIEAHGGKIWAESQGPGKGSVFIFVIPVM